MARPEEGEHKRLIENTALLLQREHELVGIRVREEQLRHWLKLAQDLPQVFADYRLPVDEILRRVRRLLITGLRLQRMMFFELEGTCLRPLAPEGTARTITGSTASLLATLPSGMCNDGVSIACAIQLIDHRPAQQHRQSGKGEHPLKAVCAAVALPLLRIEAGPFYDRNDLRQAVADAVRKEPLFITEGDGRKEPTLATLEKLKF